MKFCLNTSTIKPQPLLKKIELSGQAGYDGIELGSMTSMISSGAAVKCARWNKRWPTTASSSPA